jgi:hypothetical protein
MCRMLRRTEGVCCGSRALNREAAWREPSFRAQAGALMSTVDTPELDEAQKRADAARTLLDPMEGDVRRWW